MSGGPPAPVVGVDGPDENDIDVGVGRPASGLFPLLLGMRRRLDRLLSRLEALLSVLVDWLCCWYWL